jgi:hypothetical protein
MRCQLEPKSDDINTCLIGHMETSCGRIRCLKTIAQHCSRSPHEAKVTGAVCGQDMFCGCDKYVMTYSHVVII